VCSVATLAIYAFYVNTAPFPAVTCSASPSNCVLYIEGRTKGGGQAAFWTTLFFLWANFTSKLLTAIFVLAL